jgi:glutathione S-transferase
MEEYESLTFTAYSSNLTDDLPARAALNFKNIPYKTSWIEYPDMGPSFKALGIAPLAATETKSPSGYSSPMIQLPDGSYLMDSRNIADALETLQPEPSLQLNSGYVERTQKAVLDVGGALTPICIPRVPELLLGERSAEYFQRTRKERFGMTLDELARSEKGGEAAWEEAKPGIQEIVAILHEHEEGPYMLGETASYADLILAGYWAFLKKLDKGGDVFERLMGADEAFVKHWEACQKFLERDD